MKSMLLAAAAVAAFAAAAPAHADQGDVLLRARAIVVSPTED